MLVNLHETSLAKALRNIDNAVHKLILIIAEIALVIMVAIVTLNVFVRLFIPKIGGIVWIEEVAFILISLFTFLACAMGVRDRFHIGISILYNRFAEGSFGRRLLDIVSKVATLAVGCIMVWFGWQLCQKLGRFPMTNTHWPRWVQYMSMPIAGSVIVYDSILQLLGVLHDDDLLYSEPEVKLEVEHEKKN